MSTTPKRVREPVQAYLDADDAQLLVALSERLAISKAEVIRLGIRRLAQEAELAQRPGAGIAALMGSLDAAAELPSDLAARHDEYLYDEERSASARLRRVSDSSAGEAHASASTVKRHGGSSRRR